MTSYAAGQNGTSGRSFRKRCVALAAASLFFVQAIAVPAAWACRENAMIVFDASGSMGLFREGREKIAIARDAVAEVLPTVTRFRPTGLVTYSGASGPACTDVYLRVAPAVNTGERIMGELRAVTPSGATPLSEAVQVGAAFLQRLGDPGMIVLITDGLENCGGSACALGRQIKSQRPKVLVHVISFFLQSSAEDAIRCLAEETGGTFAATHSLEQLRDALWNVMSCHRLSALEPPGSNG